MRVTDWIIAFTTFDPSEFTKFCHCLEFLTRTFIASSWSLNPVALTSFFRALDSFGMLGNYRFSFYFYQPITLTNITYRVLASWNEHRPLCEQRIFIFSNFVFRLWVNLMSTVNLIDSCADSVEDGTRFPKIVTLVFWFTFLGFAFKNLCIACIFRFFRSRLPN